MKETILVTGGSGMVGHHFKKCGLEAIYIGRKDCDLRNSEEVKKVFSSIKPTIVIHLAAKVGGIADNVKNPVSYFEDNILINSNTIKYAYENGCKRFVGISSAGVYPDKIGEEYYPLEESHWYEGHPPFTNFSYAYAKRCLNIHLSNYKNQYGLAYSNVMPCNLYSENDHFEGDRSHFIPSLIRKISLAKLNNLNKIELFGTGKSLRQFMYAGDLARSVIEYIHTDYCEDFNIATSEIYTIKEIAEIALDVCDAKHLEIVWDSTKPDGQYRRDVSDKKFKSLFPNFQYTPLRDGIKKTFDNYYALVTK
jgi:GDP-L-fucose synthase